MTTEYGTQAGSEAGASGGEIPLSVVLQQMAEQNSQKILESLATNLKEFHFDPENGLTFDRWFSKYEDLFRQDGRSLDDAAKVRLLLRSLSVPVHEKFLNYLLPSHPRDFTFDEVIDEMKQIFGQHKSLFSKRYDCLNIEKNEADDFVTYAGIVNRQCEDLELQKLTVDQFKSLVFICGFKSSKDTDVRTRLLSKLESDQAETINLAGLVTECQRLSNLKHDTALVEKKPTSSAVQAVRQSKKQPNNQMKSSADIKTPPSPCWQCGAMHFVKDCKFSKHTCKQCGKVGHKDGYCSCFSKSSTTESKAGSKKKKPFNTKVIQIVKQVRSRRRFITVNFNGKSDELQLDCGSDITVISTHTWKLIGSPSSTVTSVEASTASREPLELVGEFTCPVTIGTTTKASVCYITSVEDLNVIGLDWLDAFDLWSKPLAANCKQVNLSNFSPSSDQHFLKQYPEVFQDGLGHCMKTKISLSLKPDAQPVFRPKRPVSFHAIQKVEEELDRLERLDIISPVDFSDWAAPIVVVKKPGGKVRVCAVYSTGFNAALETNNHPLPTPEEIFSKLSGSQVFSIIDLSDAYLQVEVDDESKKLLTINTHRGLFRFNRLAPGVKSAPGAFQQLMAKMVSGLRGVEDFLDDILVHSKTLVDHNRIIHMLFNRLRDYGLDSVYVWRSADSTRIKSTKIAAISEMPAPTDVPTLRSFLGAVNFYGKFAREMHQLRHPLDNLLKKDTKFDWSKKCQHAFQNIKKVLQSGLLLTHYNPEQEIIVAGDASKTGIGAVILHRFPNGIIKAVSHASRSLTVAEQNYSQIEKEALALVFACTKFHRLLWGRRFTLQTDHQSLLRIFGSKKGIPVHTANRLQRWALTLLGYDFNIEYVSTQDFDLPVTHKSLKIATKKDAVLQKVIPYTQGSWPSRCEGIEDVEVRSFFSRRDSYSVIDDCIMMADRIIVPKSLQKRILKQVHQGHPGIERAKAIARGIVFWPTIDEDITNYVRRCPSCANAAKSPPHAQPQPWPRAEGPWQRLHIDFAGPVNGEYYLVVVDSFSKWPEILQTRYPTTSTTTTFLRECFARFGIPTVIVSDNGSQFTSAEFRDFCEEFGIVHFRTAPYHPQSNGQAERFVDTLKRSLKKIVDGGERSTLTALQTFLYVYRSTPSAVLSGQSPAEVMLGRKMRTTLDLLRPSSKPEIHPQHQPVKRSFLAGARVYAKVYSANDKWKWMPGVVLEAIGNVNYNILLDCQVGRRKVLRSHIDQLRTGMEEVAPAPAPLSILIDDFGLTPAEPTPQLDRTQSSIQNDQPTPNEVLNLDQPTSDEEHVESAEVLDLQDTLSSEADETLLSMDVPQPILTSTPLQRPVRSTRPPIKFQDYHCYQIRGGDATLATMTVDRSQ
ncbi:uncharacterized protein K02A2.6-like [Toxorhynchites rutilus septentrionalis]|uniref:uncharacterized protein K02A2.6-like n=1 Tax=Toxorhynchites rutilus septentrionalis TaxID=329112 RepID=UPI002479BE6C|nr:uncharacterized protein K02A2.6-like [Toxorhynchites rutilus septentrionalis]